MKWTKSTRDVWSSLRSTDSDGHHSTGGRGGHRDWTHDARHHHSPSEPIATPDPTSPITPVVTHPDPIVDTPVVTPPVVTAPAPPVVTEPPPVVTPPAPPAVATPTPPVVDPVTPPPATGGPTTPATESTVLVRHDGAIHSEFNGQVIKDLDIYVTNGDAITVTHDNVIIENVRVHHVNGAGVSIQGADHVQLLNSEIINTSPPSGVNPETSENIVNVQVEDSASFRADHVTVRDGSSGFYLLNSPSATLTNVDGYDFHGPLPKGQFIQFDKSGGATVDTFYVHNDETHSFSEDNISVYASPNVTIRNGVIDGNNSETGVGVMFEKNSTGGLVEHVDTIDMGNGSFSAYAGNVIFRDVHAFDNWGGAGPRGENASDSLIFNISAPGVRIEDATYTHPYHSGNIAWDLSKAASADITQDPNATPMAHFTNHFDWTV